MKKVVYGLSLLLISGCASQGDLLRVQGELEETKGRLLKAEKEMGSVRLEAKDEIQKTIRMSKQDIDAVRKGGADLQATLEGLRVDLQVLAGKIEDVALLAKKPADDLLLLKGDTERKLGTIEERILKVSKELDRVQGDLQKKLAELQEKQAEQARTQIQTQTPEALYQAGVDAFKASDMGKSRELLTQFLELHPRHDLAANARYWLGETYYSEKKFEQAILEFQDVIKSYPGKDKVSSALLKQAMCFGEIGDAKSARYLYKKIVEDYPLSEEAKRAKEKLKELK